MGLKNEQKIEIENQELYYLAKMFPEDELGLKLEKYEKH